VSTKKRRKVSNKYARDLEALIAEYIAETGDQAWTTKKVAEWVYASGRWKQERKNAVSQLARDLSGAARNATMTDEHGNKVRKYHAFQLAPEQPTWWAEMESITRDQMDESKTMRREKFAAGCVKLHTDLDYCNRHHNPGDPLVFDPDFSKDIADKQQSSEYNDSAPAEEDDKPPTKGMNEREARNKLALPQAKLTPEPPHDPQCSGTARRAA
jgi:hypothetical protein